MTILLEYLPDEILLIICQYLPQWQIIQAFFGLNYRFNCMISQFLQSLVIKNDLDDRGLKLLSLIGPYLRSLIIKNMLLTAEQISLASNIQELTFIHTPPDPIPPLSHLTDLNIIDGPSFQSINTLFSRTNDLHSVYIASSDPLTVPLYSPPKYSTVKQLSITLQSPKHFIRLLSMCPELTCLYLNLENFNFDDQLPIEPHANLRIFFLRTRYRLIISMNQLKTVFKYLTTELEHLSIEVETDDKTFLDGQFWENYLQEHFPQLNRLEFFILFRELISNPSQPVRLSNVLKTFQSAYWSLVAPQKIIGYYNHTFGDDSICVHTDTIPTVQRRRYFLY